MPIFGWGKKSESAKPESKAPANPAAGADEPYSPAKAESLFAYARQADERDNPEYAMSLWLSGLRADPMKHEAVPAFFQSAARYRNAQGKGAKQAAAVIKGNTDLDKYLSSLLAWSLDPQSAELAVRATTAAVKLGLNESVKWLAERALALNAQADRPRKENLLNLMNIFHEAGNNELAVQAGELALRLDPADNNLRADVRDLAAQSSIDKGGYEQTTGQSGGFRSNVRDLDKQRKIEENERIVKTDEVAARVITDGPDEDLDKLNWMLHGALGAARKSIWIATPYFLPDQPLIAALTTAALRGVEIRIVLPARNNLPFVHWASRAGWWQVLKPGCRLWLTAGPFDHSKVVVIDETWSLVGSANWDARSLRLNYEINLEAYDPTFARQLVQHLETKLAAAHEVTLAEVNARPLPVRLLDGVARLFNPFL